MHVCGTSNPAPDVVAVEFSPEVISAARESFFVDAAVNNNQQPLGSSSVGHEYMYLYAGNGRYTRAPACHGEGSSYKSKEIRNSSLSLVQSCAFAWIDAAPKDAADIIIVDLESGSRTSSSPAINCACSLHELPFVGFVHKGMLTMFAPLRTQSPSASTWIEGSTK